MEFCSVVTRNSSWCRIFSWTLHSIFCVLRIKKRPKVSMLLNTAVLCNNSQQSDLWTTEKCPVVQWHRKVQSPSRQMLHVLCQTTQHHLPGHSDIHSHRDENGKSHIAYWFRVCRRNFSQPELLWHVRYFAVLFMTLSACHGAGSNDRMTVNSELEGMWKETVINKF
jgi:hypothetical protein